MWYLLLGGGVILAVFLLDYLFFKPKLDFPMPGWRLPILGHMLFIGKNPPQKFLTWGKVCGPFYMMQVLNKTTLVINDNEIFHQMCENGNFEGRRISFRLSILGQGEKDGIPKDFFSHDADQKYQRMKQSVWKLLDRMRESSYLYDLMTHTQDNLVREICGKSVDGVIVDPYDAVTQVMYNYYVSRNTGGLLPVDNSITDKIVKIVKIARVCLTSQGQKLDFFPFLKYFGNKTYTDLKEASSLILEAYREFKGQLDKKGTNPGVLSGFMNDPNLSSESEDVLASCLVVSLCGGGEPAVTCLYGVMMTLAAYPEEQEKIRREIKSRKLQRPFIPSKDCQSPYIEAFLIESLRYITPTPIFPRRAVEATSFTGRQIPKNTTVIANVYGGHHDEFKWGDPWQFRPERFLDADGNLLPKSHPARRNFKAFGESKKMCVGVPVVNDVLFSLIASLVDSFDISRLAGIDVPHDQRTWEGLALGALPGRCQMKFTPRH